MRITAASRLPSISSLVPLSRASWLCAGAAAILGFGSLAVTARPSQAAPIAWVPVGDFPNLADTSPPPYGAVAYNYYIMKYEFTNLDYTDFLNAVAKTDAYSLYNTNMGSDVRGGITRSGTSGSYVYATKANMDLKPVNYVSWFDAARVANWFDNGKTTLVSSTETGTYELVGGQTSGVAPARTGGPYRIPTENEWYKAAYYVGGGLNAGYWDYATQSDTLPTSVAATSIGDGIHSGTNFANYNRDADWNGQDGNVTTVGTNGGPSAYGTFDQSGNLSEWNDLDATASLLKGVRGGSWDDLVGTNLSSSFREELLASFESATIGFRLAVPEIDPATGSSAMALIAGVLAMFEQRRRRGAASPSLTA